MSLTSMGAACAKLLERILSDGRTRPYQPERYYMRGVGPKSRSGKGGQSRRRASFASSILAKVTGVRGRERVSDGSARGRESESRRVNSCYE